MQERRTTIRIGQRCRTQYCSSEDLLPRDGRITDVSERGVGLLVREAHRIGEILTVGFSLPGDRTTLTATGVVRWSNPPQKGRWYPVGLDWMQVEETTRNRLQQFLSRARNAPPPPAPAAAPARSTRRTVVIIAIAIALLLIGGAVWLWGRSLQWENQQLQGVVEQRETVIGHLMLQGTQLRQALGTTKTYVAESIAEIVRLDQQTQKAGIQMDALTLQVERIQDSYTQVREERESLMQHVLNLEQDKVDLAKQLATLQALRVAVQDAVDARRISFWRGVRPLDEGMLDGNGGYLLRNGRSTFGVTSRIRVHDLESFP